jgi:hypothetical protein
MAFEFRRLPGPFVLQVSVQTSGTARAIGESIGEIAGIRGPRPVTPTVRAASPRSRAATRAFETGEQIGRAAMQLALTICGRLLRAVRPASASPATMCRA